MGLSWIRISTIVSIQQVDRVLLTSHEFISTWQGLKMTYDMICPYAIGTLLCRIESGLGWSAPPRPGWIQDTMYHSGVVLHSTYVYFRRVLNGKSAV